MRFNMKSISRPHFTWLVILTLAVIVVFLRVGLYDAPVESARELAALPPQPSFTPNLTQTVDHIYANAALTLTAIALEPAAQSTPVTFAAEETGQPVGENVSSQSDSQVMPGAGTTEPGFTTSQNPAFPANTAAPANQPGVSATPTLTPPLPPTSPTAGSLQPLPPRPTSAACSYQGNTDFETTLFVLINELRIGSGVPPLTADNTLSGIAFRHSEDMACRDFYDHVGSDGSAFLDRLHNANLFSFAKAAELLYVGRGSADDPTRAFEAWLNGPSSYAQLIYPAFNQVGIGYVFKEDSSYGGYITLVLLAVPAEN